MATQAGVVRLVGLIVLSATFFESSLSLLNLLGVTVSVAGVACTRYLSHLDHGADSSSAETQGTPKKKGKREKATIPEQLRLLARTQENSESEENSQSQLA